MVHLIFIKWSKLQLLPVGKQYGHSVWAGSVLMVRATWVSKVSVLCLGQLCLSAMPG